MVNTLEPEVQRFVLATMAGLNCPRALTVSLMVKYGEHLQLAKLKCNPKDYNDPADYFTAAQATDLLRKYPGLKTGLDTEAAAIETWWACERKCGQTNTRLAPYLNGYDQDPLILSFIERVRDELAQLIGTRPPSQVNLGFGPGATVSDPSRRTTVLDKVSSQPSITSSASFVLSDWSQTIWARNRSTADISTVRGNSFFTVPKDAQTDRPCAKEPSINASYQAGVGDVLRRRLYREGFDLVDGQRLHAQAAQRASKDDSLCTIDLSSASDTISRGLVKLLLPCAWYRLLDGLRSSYTCLGGKWVRLEKFSSMGNGFTFELETAIFAAIARACTDPADASQRKQVLVYGDDIIVPAAICRKLLKVLEFFGFTPNERKTFTEGPFRESCGGDFFEGVDVRPYLLKEIPNAPQDYVSIANGLRRTMQKTDPLGPVHAGLLRAWFAVLDCIPTHIRSCRGPSELGDAVIHDAPERWTLKERPDRPCMRFIRAYMPVRFRETRFAWFHPDAQFAAALYLAGKAPDRPGRTPHGGLVPRDGVLDYGIKWIPYS